MVDAFLASEFAPHLPLPEEVAAQQGLQEALRGKLLQRREAAARRLERSFEGLRSAVDAMRAALDSLREAAAAYGVGPLRSPPPWSGTGALSDLPAAAPETPEAPQPQPRTPQPPPQTLPSGPSAGAAVAASSEMDVSGVLVFLCLTATEIGASCIAAPCLLSITLPTHML